MHSLDLGPLLDRSDRHVRRSRLRVRDAGSRARVAFTLSETLRLVSLPGEDQGRVYYFRRVDLKDVPADGNRGVWLDKMQSALTQLAERAMHGSDRRAIASDVVFFHSHEEALELLLRRIVNQEPCIEWFWPLVSRGEAAMSRGERIAAIVERLRDLPAGWIRVAHALFALRDTDGAIDVAGSLPVASVGRWLRELSADGIDDPFVPSLTLPQHVERLLARAVQRFGREDPRTIWLASLAVLLASPRRLGGSLVAQSRATLRRIEATYILGDDGERTRLERGTSSSIVFDDVSSGVAPPQREPRVTEHRVNEPRVTLSLSKGDTGKRESDERVCHDTRLLAPTQRTDETAARDPGLDAGAYLGTRTTAGGLYFLLNPMARLGIAKVATDVRFAQARIGARALMQLAVHAGVEASDPILAWVSEQIAQSNEAFASLQLESSAWPSIFGSARQRELDVSYVVRAWALAVRRWCWRTGHLSIREIVNRNGRVLSSRTDVDVTFALDDADVRIRRVGLDIDPGWLPWFGCVVRFHYVAKKWSPPAC